MMGVQLVVTLQLSCTFCPDPSNAASVQTITVSADYVLGNDERLGGCFIGIASLPSS
jgi:hypothetical protein